jgi:hypothetical protein
MNDQMSERMLTARGVLVDRVEASRRRRLPALVPTLGLLLVGAIVGGAASAAVAAAIGGSSAEPSITPIPAPQLGEELPGTPIFSTVGEVQVFTLTESTEITLETPPGATTVSIRLSCTSEGALSVSAMVHGGPLGTSCEDVPADVIAGGGFASGFGFSPLEPSLTLGVSTNDGTIGSLSVQFTREVSTALATNSSGQTYGVAWHGDYPDLVAVVGSSSDGRPIVGYVPQHVVVRPTSDKAAEWKRELQEQYPDDVIPLTTGDGVTAIGTYWVDDDANALWLDELWADLQKRYPDAERPPGAQLSPSRVPAEWPAAMATCMAGLGVQDVTVRPDGSLEHHPVDEAFELAEYQCWAQNPLGAHAQMGPE